MSEINNENIQLLADNAFEVENFKLAYDYYNRLLESNLEDSKNWIRKGICAIKLSKFDAMLDKEALSAIKTGFQLETYPEQELTDLLNKISSDLYEKILESVKFIQSEIDREFNALQIPAGTLYAVNQMRKTSINLKVWNEYKHKLFHYFKLMDYIVKLKPTPISCEKGYRSVNYTNTVSEQSGKHFFQLDSSSDEGKLLSGLLLFSKLELEKDNPQNTVTNPKSSSGCFIATATMGNYDHFMVMELRTFRDDWLLRKKWGQNFTSWYYQKGPIAARFIDRSVLLKAICFSTIVFPLYLLAKKINKNQIQ
jgi:hypothetical protein